ncbi:glucose n-acetyltransferase [Colletotrichum karsti]|uniref:Glucose n-acetyltransferase n=1 Tax=Colletotrichum karsti TaxID=1095194 RepID=A0A9P6IBP1_9PEZI|nr:glucose n-acetyltransferase [Colletotrichum karsti]KAF9878861.1 glucose n-acetyltransferase [Colletotrichum karsti]
MAPDHRPAPVKELVQDLSSWKPKWTTEKLEPKFAYAQYATSMDYLCNAVINFGRLRRYGAKEDLVLIHPKDWLEGTTREAKALAKLRIERPEINMRAFDVISTNKGDATWRDSLTKFHAFALTEWTRILAFDSDALVLNTMDHYFLSPKAPVAVPRAYWLNEQDTDIAKQVLGSHVMLIEPDEKRYHKIINEAMTTGEFDMEVINHMFKGSAMILPHRRLALLTGEFRAKDHSKYLAPEEDEEWNAMAEVSRSYLVHFSDWPLPKPWLPRTKQQWQAVMPECPKDAVAKPDQPRCADRFMWTGFYEDYDREKSNQCSIVME